MIDDIDRFDDQEREDASDTLNQIENFESRDSPGLEGEVDEPLSGKEFEEEVLGMESMEPQVRFGEGSDDEFLGFKHERVETD